MRALQNPNDTAFRAVTTLRARETFVARDPRHDLITMHRCACVLGRDEKILFACFFAREKSKTGLVNGERSRH